MAGRIKSVKQHIPFVCFLCLYAAVLLFWNFEGEMDAMNTTVFALSYEHGFMARAVMGTFLSLWDSLSNVDLISYHTVYQISEAITFVFYVMTLLWIVVCLVRSDDRHVQISRAVIILIATITFPFFVTKDNLGRMDVYLAVITIFCLILLVRETWEWLIVPACVIATLFHEGFVFMNLNLILVLLFYKILTSTEKKKRIKYILLFTATLLGPVVLFAYFEFFSHTFGADVYDQVFAKAIKLSSSGTEADVHLQLLQHEILGQDIYASEWEYHRWNREDLPFLLLFFAPFFAGIIAFFKKLFRPELSGNLKLAYLAIAVGPATLIPEIVLKCDYGRYLYAILFYYLAVVLSLFAMREENVLAAAEGVYATVKDKIKYPVIVAAYLALLMPLRSYRVCDFISWFVKLIFHN